MGDGSTAIPTISAGLRPAAGEMMRIGRILACAAFVLCVGVLVNAADSTVRRLEVVRDARVRAEPDDKTAPTLSYLRTGEVVPLLEQRDKWYKVNHNGVHGWVYMELVRPVSELRAEELFSQQNISVRPPELAPEDSTPRIRYARLRSNSAIVRSHIDPNDPNYRVIRIPRDNDGYLPLVHEGTSWCLVWVESESSDNDSLFEGQTGWIQCSSIDIVDEKPTGSVWDSVMLFLKDSQTIFIGVAGIVGLILIIVVISAIRRMSSERKRNVFVQKNVLIIAKEPKSVLYTLTNATLPIERCFTELGFNVTSVKDSVVARNSIEHSMPDLILIDWNFETAIFTKIENLFSRLTISNNTYILFFNVPDLTATPHSDILRNVSFLGLTVSDRDIFHVVTPLLHSEQQGNNIQKSLQRSALEGEIEGGNLLEVLQFIEIGSRTGCLMVENNGPFALIYFRDGRIIYAADANKNQGVEAVYATLNQTSGKFRFITNKEPKAANLNLPTLSVLMEWTRLKDESKRRP